MKKRDLLFVLGVIAAILVMIALTISPARALGSIEPAIGTTLEIIK